MEENKQRQPLPTSTYLLAGLFVLLLVFSNKVTDTRTS